MSDAGERADAIPEAAVKAAAHWLAPDGVTAETLTQARTALAAAAPFFRAAHPEAGSEEDERPGNAPQDVDWSCESGCRAPEVERLREYLQAIEVESSLARVRHLTRTALRAAHPEADRAPVIAGEDHVALDEALADRAPEDREACGRWDAPWTDEQVAVLAEYQASGRFHPYTCGSDSSHGPLTPTHDGWVCESCPYCQGWAHAHAHSDRAPEGCTCKFSARPCPTCRVMQPDRAPGEVETVARAIYDTQDNPIPWDSETLGDWRKDYERKKARAAIAALDAARGRSREDTADRDV